MKDHYLIQPSLAWWNTKSFLKKIKDKGKAHKSIGIPDVKNSGVTEMVNRLDLWTLSSQNDALHEI